MSADEYVRFLMKNPQATSFVYRSADNINSNKPQAQNATLGVNFAQGHRILDDWYLFGGTYWSRMRYRLKHPVIYSKRGLRQLYAKIKRIFVKPKMIQPMIRHPQSITKPRGVCHGCYQEQENAAQSDQRKP